MDKCHVLKTMYKRIVNWETTLIMSSDLIKSEERTPQFWCVQCAFERMDTIVVSHQLWRKLGGQGCSVAKLTVEAKVPWQLWRWDKEVLWSTTSGVIFHPAAWKITCCLLWMTPLLPGLWEHNPFSKQKQTKTPQTTIILLTIARKLNFMLLVKLWNHPIFVFYSWINYMKPWFNHTLLFGKILISVSSMCTKEPQVAWKGIISIFSSNCFLFLFLPLVRRVST